MKRNRLHHANDRKCKNFIQKTLFGIDKRKMNATSLNDRVILRYLSNAASGQNKLFF
jgi:hypothetical protein